MQAAAPLRTQRPPVPAPDARTRSSAPPDWIRGAVRDVLQQAPGYHALGAGERRALAHAMVRVSSLAAQLIEEEHSAPAAVEPPRRPPLARAQSQPGFGTAADRIAQTTHAVLNAVSFPRFVTDLINGVFRAMLDSNQTQMQQYVNLLNAVSASAEGFEGAQFGLVRVRQWLADQFPESIEYEAPEVEPGEAPDPDEVASARLRLRSGATMPPPEIIRATLGMGPDDPLEAGSPEQLVPVARRHLARQRQQMLATMITLGMQRIVIDSGRINAAMRFHIDTRSAANQDQASQTSVQNRIRGGGSFGFGPWGASAEVENTIGYVSTQRSQSTEEMNTDLDLNSSVELNFRSDYLPLNRIANQAQADRIRSSTLNPAAASTEDPAAARAARQAAQRAAEEARRTATPLSPVPAPSAPASTPAAPRPSTPAAGGAAPTGTGGAAPTAHGPAAPRPTPPAAAGAAGTGAPVTPTPTPAAPRPTPPAAGGGAGTGAPLGPAPAAPRPAGPAAAGTPSTPAPAPAGSPGAGAGTATATAPSAAAPAAGVTASGAAPPAAPAPSPPGTAGTTAAAQPPAPSPPSAAATGSGAPGSGGTSAGSTVGSAVGTAVGGTIGGGPGAAIGGAVGTGVGGAIVDAIGRAI